jgi:hypothetical protein
MSGSRKHQKLKDSKKESSEIKLGEKNWRKLEFRVKKTGPEKNCFRDLIFRSFGIFKPFLQPRVQFFNDMVCPYV